MADMAATLADAKAQLRIADATDDAYLTALLEGVTDWIQDYVRRKVVPEAGATYLVDTAYGSTIYLPRGIRTVTTLGIATTHQPDTGGTYTTIASTGFATDPHFTETTTCCSRTRFA